MAQRGVCRQRFLPSQGPHDRDLVAGVIVVCSQDVRSVDRGTLASGPTGPEPLAEQLAGLVVGEKGLAVLVESEDRYGKVFEEKLEEGVVRRVHSNLLPRPTDRRL